MVYIVTSLSAFSMILYRFTFALPLPQIIFLNTSSTCVACLKRLLRAVVAVVAVAVYHYALHHREREQGVSQWHDGMQPLLPGPHPSICCSWWCSFSFDQQVGLAELPLIPAHEMSPVTANGCCLKYTVPAEAPHGPALLPHPS